MNAQLDSNIQLFYTKNSIKEYISVTKFFEYFTTSTIIDGGLYGFAKMIAQGKYEEAARDYLDAMYQYMWLEENDDAQYSQEETDNMLVPFLVEIYRAIGSACESGDTQGINYGVKVFKD